MNTYNFAGYRIKDLCNWTTFKKMDMAIQISFIKALTDDYDVNITDLSNLFNIDRYAVDFYVKKHNIPTFRGRSFNENKRKQWQDFLHTIRLKRNENKLDTIAEQMVHGDLTFKGVTEEVLANIAILCKGKNVTINVTW